MKKNKILAQTWAKLLAFAIAMVSGLAVLFCAVFTVLFGVVDVLDRPEGELKNEINRQLMRGYYAELYKSSGLSSNWNTDAADTPDWDALDGGNIRYSIFVENGVLVYSNDRSVDEKNCLESYEMAAGSAIIRAGRDNFFNLLSRERVQSGRAAEETAVSEIVYDESDGLFYYKGKDDNYYLLTEFDLETDWENRHFELRDQTAGTREYQDDTDKKLTVKEIKELEEGKNSFLFSGGTSLDLNIRFVGSVPENAVIPTEWVNFQSTDGYAWLEYEPAVKESGYKVCMDVADSLTTGVALNNGMTDYFPQAEKLCGFLLHFRHTSGWYLALSVILFLSAFVFLMQAAGRRVENEEICSRFVDRIPFEILTLAVLGMVVGFAGLGVLLVDLVYDSSISFSLGLAGVLLAMCLCAAVFLVYCMSFSVRVKTKGFWRHTLLHYLWMPFRWAKQMLVAKTPLLFKALVVFGTVTVIEAIGVAVCMYDEGAMACGFIFFKLMECVALLWLIHQLYRIREGGRRIAAGDYSTPIDTSHMLGELKKHAENINNVGNGISQAVEARMKSERFKTELITNVSHDIKTPLTSIINYVDLMKKEPMENPTVLEYVEILERQSARLKKLIEDLMEASKASTGNLPVHLEVCDATVMLTQVVGEFEDRAKANHLELVVESAQPPANIMADGRHLWRIIDNLMSNICKYAMPGTRVYINLEKFHGMVIMTFRNISKSRLNITSEELMERFVRGDSSRNTEGNGLGLSIAQSLTGLMNGNLALQIDGDLFKVILSFEECKNQS